MGGPLFVGAKCEHECPNSAESECGGRGKCKQASVGKTFQAVCECDDGYFGAGCQKTCPGTNDPKPAGQGVCGGHGVCGNVDPALTGHGVGKKCLCNEIGGWYPDKLTGGSCALSCPGADPHGAAKATTGTAIKEYNKVCNGRGKGWKQLDSKDIYQKVPSSSRGCTVTPGVAGSCGCDLTKTGSNNAEARQNNGAGPTSCAGVDKNNAGPPFWQNNARGNIYSAQQHCTCNHGGRVGRSPLTPAKMAKSSAAELLRKSGSFPKAQQCFDRGSVVDSDTWKNTYSPGATKPTDYFDSIRQCGDYTAQTYYTQHCWHESYFGGW